jgi:hypothetical protein
MTKTTERSKEEIAQEIKVTAFINDIKATEEKHSMALRPQLDFTPNGLVPKLSVVAIPKVEKAKKDK